jgi:hypothetical protein
VMYQCHFQLLLFGLWIGLEEFSEPHQHPHYLYYLDLLVCLTSTSHKSQE